MKDYGSSPSDYSTDVLGQKAVDYINTTNQPFFLHFSPIAPHWPYTPAPRHANADVGPITFDPSFNETDVSDKPLRIQQIQPKNPLEMETKLTDQYRTALSLDEWIKKIVVTLQNRKILSRTVIIFISDNSFSWGEHRLVGKTCGYDNCNHVPLLIRYPNFIGRQIPNLVTNTDIAQTIADVAGINLLNPDGVSLVPLLKMPGSLNRKGILIKWSGEGYLTVGFQGIIKDNWKYMELATGEKELYNRITDPYELNNVAGKPVYAQLEIQLHNDLMDLLNK